MFTLTVSCRVKTSNEKRYYVVTHLQLRSIKIPPLNDRSFDLYWSVPQD